MYTLFRLVICSLLLSVSTAWAGLKWKDCVNSNFLEWREYLVGGSQGAAGNELWGRGNAGTCGVELWDLTLIQATVETAPSGYQAKYVTQYDHGFVGVNAGSYASSLVHWNVSGTVTALLKSEHLMESVLYLTGTSTEHPGETLQMEIATHFDPTEISSGCLPWDEQSSCPQYQFIGDIESGPKTTTITSSYIQVVPEPISLALVGVGLAGLGFLRRKGQQ